MSDDMITLDHIDNIVVSREMHHNNLNVLRSLDIGMFHLAMFTRQREIEVLEKYGKDKIVGLVEVTEESLLLGCIFDWFAISLVSYMSTIKLMQLLEDNGWELSHLRKKANKEKLLKARNAYNENVAPDVLDWRNKIAAHRVATDPRSDNLSMLTYSTMVDITYSSPFYRAGSTRVWVGNMEEEWNEYRQHLPESKKEGISEAWQRHKLILGKAMREDPLAIEPWALTEKYETLIQRYWPGRELPMLDW